MALSNSSKRSIRTAVQVIFGVLAGAALLLPVFGAALSLPVLVSVGGTVVAVAAGASKAWAALEAAGRVPLWLQDGDDASSVVSRIEPELPLIEAAAAKL